MWTWFEMSRNAAYLLQDDSLGVGCASEGVGLPAGAQVSLLVVKIGPDLK